MVLSTKTGLFWALSTVVQQQLSKLVKQQDRLIVSFTFSENALANQEKSLFPSLMANSGRLDAEWYIFRKTVAEEIDRGDGKGFVKLRLRTIPVLEDRDEKLVAPRLTHTYNVLDSQENSYCMIGHLGCEVGYPEK